MLDVHPPHEAAHTWKDFFIHIATIVIGLLIAIGLEQTVEMVHRASERRELLRAIHAECEENVKTLASDIASMQPQIEWATRVVKALLAAPVTHGTIKVTFPAYPSVSAVNAPSRAVWAVAHSSGKAALLPENVAETFDRLDRQAEQCLLAIDRTNTARQAVANFEVKTGKALEPGQTSQLTLAHRDELLGLLAAVINEEASAVVWAARWEGASQAVLHGATTRGDLAPYMVRAEHAALGTH